MRSNEPLRGVESVNQAFVEMYLSPVVVVTWRVSVVNHGAGCHVIVRSSFFRRHGGLSSLIIGGNGIHMVVPTKFSDVFVPGVAREDV